MLRLHLVGGIRAWLDDEVVEAPASRRAWHLLGWLALHPGPHPRGTVAAVFWPGVPEPSARGSLRSAVWALRRALGPAADQHLLVERQRIGLRADLLRTDVAEVERRRSAGDLAGAAELLTGDLLADVDEDWAVAERTAFRVRAGELLEELGSAAESAGDLTAALDWTRRQLALDELDEVAVRRLLRRLAAAGDRAAAVAAYARFSARLGHELGVEPAPETQRLGREVAEDLPTRNRSREPWRLTGRERGLGALLEAWRRASRGRAAAVVVRGEPGIGKTRLATELLEQAVDEGARAATAPALDLASAAPLTPWAELVAGLSDTLPAPPGTPPWAAGLAPLSPGAAARGRRPVRR